MSCRLSFWNVFLSFWKVKLVTNSFHAKYVIRIIATHFRRCKNTNSITIITWNYAESFTLLWRRIWDWNPNSKLKNCRVIANISGKGCVTCPKCSERLQTKIPRKQTKEPLKIRQSGFYQDFLVRLADIYFDNLVNIDFTQKLMKNQCENTIFSFFL